MMGIDIIDEFADVFTYGIGNEELIFRTLKGLKKEERLEIIAGVYKKLKEYDKKFAESEKRKEELISKCLGNYLIRIDKKFTTARSIYFVSSLNVKQYKNYEKELINDHGFNVLNIKTLKSKRLRSETICESYRLATEEDFERLKLRNIDPAVAVDLYAE